jgi:hypothetical protein
MRAVARELTPISDTWVTTRLDALPRRLSSRQLARRGRIFVLGQAEGPDAGLAEREFARGVADRYYEGLSAPLTTTLTQSIGDIHERLRSENERYVPEDRQYASLVCLVLHEADAYIAIVGRGVAYAVTSDGVQSVPPSLSQAPLSEASLGAQAPLTIDLFRYPLTARSAFVLGADVLSRQAPPSALWEAMLESDLPDVAGVLRELLARSGETGGRLLVVDVDPELPPTAPPEVSAPARAPSATSPAEPAAAPEPPSPASPSSVPVAIAPQDASDAEPPPWARPRAGDYLVAFLAWLSHAYNRVADALTPTVVLRVVIGGMAILGIVAAFAIAFRLTQSRQEAIADADVVVWAERREREALAATDSAQRIKLLEDANELGKRAVRLRRGDPTPVAISARIQAELDSAVQVVRLAAPARMAVLDGEPIELAYGNGDLYVLNQAVDRVYGFQLDATGMTIHPFQNPVVLRRGDRLGDFWLERPRRLLWMPGGSARPDDCLLVFDDAGALAAYSPAAGAQPVRSPGGWLLDHPIAGYAGSIFVLEARTGALRWISPARDGYDGRGYDYLIPSTPTAASDGVSLAVDGDVYALRSSGRIDRYAAGKPALFDGHIPDHGLGPRAKLITQPGSLYVFDPSDRRLVQFSRDGRFLRQYALPGETPPISVALDERSGLLYLLDAQGLYFVKLGTG